MQVVDLARLHHDADLTARLDRERLLDAREAGRDGLQLGEALDVVGHDLAPCARAGGADRVGRGDERTDHRDRLDIAVVADHAVDHGLGEAVALEELATDDGVRPFDLVVDGLADVVQQAGPLDRLLVVARFRGEHPRDVRDLDRVAEHVLSERRPEVQAAEVLHEIRMERADPDLVDGGLASLLDRLVDLRARAAHRLFDARRVDAAVDEEPLEGPFRDLAPDGVEARHDHRLRRVVDDHVDAGQGLEGADVATLAADDAALHVVARKRDRGHRVLGGVLRGVTLQGDGDDRAGLLVRAFAGLDLVLADLAVRDVAHLLLDALEEQAAGFLLAEAGDAGELGTLLFLELFDLRPLGVERGLFLGELALASGELGDLSVDLLVLLVQPALIALEFGPALAVLGLSRFRDLDGLVFGLEDDVLLLGPGLSKQTVGGGASGRLAVEGDAPADQESHPEPDRNGHDEDDEPNDERVGHGQSFLSVCPRTRSRRRCEGAGPRSRNRRSGRRAPGAGSSQVLSATRIAG